MDGDFDGANKAGRSPGGLVRHAAKHRRAVYAYYFHSTVFLDLYSQDAACGVRLTLLAVAVCSAMCCGWRAFSGLAVSQAPRRCQGRVRTSSNAGVTHVLSRQAEALSPRNLGTQQQQQQQQKGQTRGSRTGSPYPAALSNRLALVRAAALVRTGTLMGNSVRC